MKLLIAIMKKEDKADTIAALNQKGIFVTELATTGGFLQEKNTTLMIGTEDANAAIALNVLREYAGLRKSITYSTPHTESGNAYAGANYSVPIDTSAGGCTVFELTMDRLEKFCVTQPGCLPPNADSRAVFYRSAGMKLHFLIARMLTFLHWHSDIPARR